MQEYKVTILSEYDNIDAVRDLATYAAKDVSYLGISEFNVVDALWDFDNSDITDKVLFLLIYRDSPVGLLAAAKGNNHPLLVDVAVASEIFWYVLPDHRGNKESLKLVAAYETWAKANGARFVSMAHFHDDIGERLSVVYKRLGYRPIEHVYVKELSADNEKEI